MNVKFTIFNYRRLSGISTSFFFPFLTDNYLTAPPHKDVAKLRKFRRIICFYLNGISMKTSVGMNQQSSGRNLGEPPHNLGVLYSDIEVLSTDKQYVKVLREACFPLLFALTLH